MGYSKKWIMWRATIDIKTCLNCRKNNGKIFSKSTFPYKRPMLHPRCRCLLEKVKSMLAGNATRKREKGADWYLKYYGTLPDYYITVENAEHLGYRTYLGNLSEVAPNKMLFKGVYQNWDGHLPTCAGRIWYEADINYEYGYRGTERIIFSNDGLIFVTYDHYSTFIEIE